MFGILVQFPVANLRQNLVVPSSGCGFQQTMLPVTHLYVPQPLRAVVKLAGVKSSLDVPAMKLISKAVPVTGRGGP
jgi:hypothetical protein